MKIRKQYIKPEIKIFSIDQDSILVGGSSSEVPGIDKDPHQKVVDPNEQLAKPAGTFPFSTDYSDSPGWDD